MSIQICLSQSILPRRLNWLQRAYSWYWCCPASNWSSSGVACFSGYLLVSAWGHPFDVIKVCELFCTNSIDDGDMKIQWLCFWFYLVFVTPRILGRQAVSKTMSMSTYLKLELIFETFYQWLEWLMLIDFKKKWRIKQ